MPHSRPATTMDTLIDAPTPMLVRYSTWMGETLRSTLWLRSSGAVCPASTSSGTDW